MLSAVDDTITKHSTFPDWSTGGGSAVALQRVLELVGWLPPDEGAPGEVGAPSSGGEAYLKTSLIFSPACLRLPLA